TPITKVLEEEIERVPNAVWPAAKKEAEVHRFRAGLEQWTAGKTAATGRNAELMNEAVTAWQDIANDLRRYGLHPSTVPIPDRVRADMATVPMGHADRSGQYVAGLGRSLFGEYLFAVELAGTLLLIATIGTIAVAFRRKEASP